MRTDQQVAEWRAIARAAEHFGTPFYIVWAAPFAAAVRRAQAITIGRWKRRLWYSYKSQPVPALARFARDLGMGIEVVSPFELHAAQHMGFRPEETLVNGPAKHHWMPRDVLGLNVVFDSLREVRELAPAAKALGWRCGLRVAVPQQINADAPQFPVQFGMCSSEIKQAVDELKSKEVELDILHFHLRSNVPDVSDYRYALEYLRDVADEAVIAPRIIDIGGGLPDPSLPTQPHFPTVSLEELGEVLALSRPLFPKAEEIWLELGRALLAPAGALVVSVLDIKERSGFQVLICDGGRTNHALPSDWETHDVATARHLVGAGQRDTIISGPSCMAFDSFYQGAFSSDIRTGDRIIYFSAGSYHIPWETRFSFGECRVLWVGEDGQIEEIRIAESVEQWLGRWQNSGRCVPPKPAD